MQKLLTIAEVAAALTVSASTLKRLIREGEFPEPVHPTDGASAWYEDDVRAYVHLRTQAHRYRKAGTKPAKTDDPLDDL